MQRYNKFCYKFIQLSLIIFLTFVYLTIETKSDFSEKIMEIVSEDEIYEGRNFSVSVFDPEFVNLSDIETPYLSDVEIEFNEMKYYINEDLEVTIKAPNVTENKIFNIKATKEGYVTAYKNISILNINNYKLEIIHNSYIVDADKKFSVQIIDEGGYVVSDVEVYIQNSEEPSSITNEKGYATLKAPNNKENFIIIAQKEGYDYATQIFSVNIQPSIWDFIIKNQYFPIFIGAILLISAIIFVNFRQKISVYSRSTKISDKKTLKKHNLKPFVKIISNENDEIPEKQYYSRNIIRPQQNQDTKIEEIRISRPCKEKKIISIKDVEEETDKIINRRKFKKDVNEWFKGTDDIRYEIDKITGVIDENTVDKWFEGYDDIKDKINERIKKKDKSNDKN